MSTHDPISDLITRIRNAQMRSKSKVSSPGSKMRANVLEVLKSEGYIRGYERLQVQQASIGLTKVFGNTRFLGTKDTALLLEVTDAAISVFGPGGVSIRVSPLVAFNDMAGAIRDRETRIARWFISIRPGSSRG